MNAAAQPVHPKNLPPTAFDACIGRNLRSMRLMAGLAQQDIARLLGVTFQQVQKYEKGSNRLPLTMLQILRSFYAVPYDAFFAGLAETAETRSAVPLAFAAYDDMTVKICQRLAAIGDPALKHKIGQIIDVLAA